MSLNINTPVTNQNPTNNKFLIGLLTILFGAFCAYLLYLIIQIWPSGTDDCKLTSERRYLLLMILGGGLGASVHLIISFTAFAGNRAFITSWIPWYLLRPFVGAGLAMFFYMLLRGGILTYLPPDNPPSANTNADTSKASTQVVDTVAIRKKIIDSLSKNDSAFLQQPDSVKVAKVNGLMKNALPEKPKNTPPDNKQPVPLNPYGMMAIACMVGLFSKEASKKLEELFKTLFNVRDKERVPYNDKLPTDKRSDAINTITSATTSTSSTAAEDIDDVLTDADNKEDETKG